MNDRRRRGCVPPSEFRALQRVFEGRGLVTSMRPDPEKPLSFGHGCAHRGGAFMEAQRAQPVATGAHCRYWPPERAVTSTSASTCRDSETWTEALLGPTHVRHGKALAAVAHPKPQSRDLC